MTGFGIDFLPLLPWPWLAAAGVLGGLLVALGLLRRAPGTGIKAAVLALLLLVMLDPRLVRERTEDIADLLLVIRDVSASQDLGQRRERTDRALDAVREMAGRFDDLKLRLVDGGGRGPGTPLFADLERAVAGIPAGRMAGAILITDGQVHDRPRSPIPVPLHVLLTGDRGEVDRRLVLEKAPPYAIVGGDAEIVFRVEDGGRTPVEVTIAVDGGGKETLAVRPGVSTRHPVSVDQAGPMVIEIKAAAGPDELTAENNRALFTLEGVRDRLRVLLISGLPHAGLRVWRDLLKSDPQIDLVHFTILRPPEKIDPTPIDELALISFPVQELFEERLKDFDLLVFDRYIVRGVLPPEYYGLVADYVRGGGALMVAGGPELVGRRGPAATSLAEILPFNPTGRLMEGGFRPQPTPRGRRHPVVDIGDPADWGRWFRQVEGLPEGGEVLLEGLMGMPLLLVDRVEKGRVAVLTSDHLWLWARGVDEGGPHADLVRRLAHWLMKEPELEEESLTASAGEGRLTIERRSLETREVQVEVASPAGEVTRLDMVPGPDGRAVAAMAATETGLYRIDDGDRQALAVVGVPDPLELSDLASTPDRLAPWVERSGGGIHWLADGSPAIRRIEAGRPATGRGWIGLWRNPKGVGDILEQVPLLPPVSAMLLLLGLLLFAWRREGSG